MKEGVFMVESVMGQFTAAAYYQDNLLSIAVRKFGVFYQAHKLLPPGQEQNLCEIAKKEAVKLYMSLKTPTTKPPVHEDSQTRVLIETIFSVGNKFCK